MSAAMSASQAEPDAPPPELDCEFVSSSDAALHDTVTRLCDQRVRLEQMITSTLDNAQVEWNKLFTELVRPSIERAVEAEVSAFDNINNNLAHVIQVWAEHEAWAQEELDRLRSAMARPAKVRFVARG